MTPPTDEFEKLRLLRDAYHKHLMSPHARDHTVQRKAIELGEAAHAALGPEGCVTRELERLRSLERRSVTVESEDGRYYLSRGVQRPTAVSAKHYAEVCSERDALKKLIEGACDEKSAAHAERDALIAKHKLVSEAYADYRTTTDEVIATLERHAKDAARENAVLLARLVKLSEAATAVLLEDFGTARADYTRRDALRAVLNEIPPR